ncbi:MAG TPA: D-glycerate dehydrogenase [Myxococcales bacterium]|nr:D-glycerate dehydrogenase [Myxococcales bacterium]
MSAAKDRKARIFVARTLSIDPRPVVGPALEVDIWEGELPPPRAELLKRAAQADGLVTLLTEKVDGELLAHAPALKVVANHAVGVDNIDVAACTARGVWVTNTPDAVTESTADLTWALILAVARRLREGERLIREGRFHAWAPTMLLGLELNGAVLGIVGLGRIGRAVARRAAGFGMQVLHTSSSGGVALDELLERSDVVSLHCPLNARTHHLIDAQRLSRMKRGAILVNTSRGAVVDEAALVAALQAGRLSGAGLDVFENEPAVHPGLIGRDDVVLLPHLGSATHKTRARMATMALTDAARVLRGQRPLHPVNDVSSSGKGEP